MSPIPLGILAASGGVAFNPAFDLLETQVLNSSETSVTFSSLSIYASDYQHLQIRGVARASDASTLRMNRMRFNGDSLSNYSTHHLFAFGSGSPGSSSDSPTTGMLGFYGTANSSPSGAFGAGVIDIFDAFETTKYKTTRGFGGQSSYPAVHLTSGSWRNLNAISSITIFNEGGHSFLANTRFSLYGIKAGA